jgi:hypothetical protein
MRILSSIRRTLARLGHRPVLENLLTVAAFLGGLVLVAVGVGMISLSAGLIVAGAELTVGAALYERGAAS